MTAKPKIGRRMHDLHVIVAACPGISKSQALRCAGLPVRGPGSGRELNRAIAAGLVVVEKPQVNLCALFATEADARWWRLTREYYAPSTPAARVREISDEMDAITADHSGVFVATVTTAGGRVVTSEGDRDEIDFWLSEFRKCRGADRPVSVEVRELTVAEVNSGGPCYASPGA